MFQIVVWWRSFVVESKKAAEFLRDAAKTTNSDERRRLTQLALNAENDWREARGLRRE
ncbi:MAG: hypothetical protein HY980_03930 [Candidatus Magasanikbacteria bacterium]|nr:hypothetical protein [Candidatus Magasanikbacteria bacterium]